MSRWDLTGLFWDDYVAPREKKVKEKRTPPDPVWLLPDYLPDLETARAHKYDFMTDQEILTAQACGDRLVWDIEVYPNYCLFGFRHMKSGKLIMFELFEGQVLTGVALEKFKWVLTNFLVVGFNDQAFDIPIAMAIIAGATPQKLSQYADLLINGGDYGNGLRPYEFYRQTKIKEIYVNSIDLIELTPLGPSLKICAGRIHAPRMADLPFPPGIELTPDQITILRWYWTNDLQNTELLYNRHKTAIELRELLTSEYGVDVRSKSDPQIAEEVIKKEIQTLTGERWLKRAKVEAGKQFMYRPPAYVRYQSPTMQWVLDFIKGQVFTIGSDGKPNESEELKKLVFTINKTDYKMGIGGLHSREKKRIRVASEGYELEDSDVTSYYPSLIIQQGMYPPHIGPVFLKVFKRIYDRRLHAKATGDAGTSETLKIVLNGTFGKTGERGGRSVMYYPEMMIQVTLSGQLALLMLIERLELAGIEVISANTDGIVTYCPIHLRDTRDAIKAQWEKDTGLGLESSGYKAVYSRDVNNYIALLKEPSKKATDGFKYAKAIGTYRKVLDVYPMKWNPTCDIVAEAVIAFLGAGIPVAETIKGCTDFRKFIEVRRVTGGAVKDGVYLGKAIRWYYAAGEEGAIINASNGYDVPMSQGGKPCMTMPEGMPDDIDFEYYIERAEKMLESDFEPKSKAKIAA